MNINLELEYIRHILYELYKNDLITLLEWQETLNKLTKNNEIIP